MQRRVFLLIVLALVFGSPFVGVDPAFGGLVHTSRENYYSTGGTRIASCSGEGCVASTWNVGDITGVIQWHVVSQIYKDAGQTQFKYTVTNDLFAASITGLHVGNNGKEATAATTAANWTFSQNSTEWVSQTTSAAAGIAKLSSKLVMTVTVGELVPIVFTSATGIDFISGCTPPCLKQPNWVIASAGPLVPEPGTLALVGTGLVAGGVWARKRVSKARSLRGLLLPSATRQRP